ncbi:TlpA disulfide reductase family protein [Aeromicrobium sp. Leaf350]|uniref:TlpA family protein disulfide reductase n=1 Tax=Aeromicrobium sp. Leaf350 TaxID=2876565 RepID=UPI001E5E0C9F|nr:TlpA disulfide reductase family protein [Aeromicrobium sp. Leaf350]
MKRLAAAAIAALLVVGACAPDRAGDAETNGAPVDTAVTTAAHEAGIAGCPAPSEGADADTELGGLELVCVSTGDPVDLAAFDGPVVVNVWAHWCEPCREELPLLARAAQEYAGQVTFVGVLFADEDPRSAISLAQETGVTYPQVADPTSSLRAALSLRGLPTTAFLVDGEVVGSQLTPYDDYGVLVADIAEHLEVGK